MATLGRRLSRYISSRTSTTMNELPFGSASDGARLNSDG